MGDLHAAFVSKSSLRSHWDLEYRARQDSDNEKAGDDRLHLSATRTDLEGTSAESAFIEVFVRGTWCYANWPLGIARQDREMNAFAYALYSVRAEEI
jgi:hypothetical protein